MNSPLSLRALRPASREKEDLLAPRLRQLNQLGFHTLYDDQPMDPDWAYSAATATLRARALQDALTEPDTAAIICARGGYGASDLLPLLDWQALAKAKPKPVIGFSDISALHAGLYARLGWHGLHAPMPATTLWPDTPDSPDLKALLACLEALHTGAPMSGSLQVTAVRPGPGTGIFKGWLFGGCFSVLTNLIGTPYFPSSLRGAILFLEDTDEHPGRLMRMLNQWRQSGVLEGVTALVIGHLRKLGDNIPDCAPFVLERFAKVAGLPTFHSPDFGHTRPNFPILVGGLATLANSSLAWVQPPPGGALRPAGTPRGESRQEA